jgi:cyclopropane fatty-acyl-phospholipid synthase-like methyltransferase
MSNINDTYFDSYYKVIWKTIIPAELTVKEVDFMVPYFKLEAGSKVLDLMCGYGRHAIALAQKGITVTAVDNLGDYTAEIKEVAAKENLPVTVVKEDVLSFTSGEQYDLALCMGNSLNFFNAADTVMLLQSVAAQLKPGGSLLINTWSIAEIVFKSFMAKSWSMIGEYKFLTDSKISFHPTRLETESIIIAADGTSETKPAVDYIFSLNEMEAMLKEAGFTLKEVYSIPGKKKFTVGEPRAYLVATKE